MCVSKQDLALMPGVKKWDCSLAQMLPDKAHLGLFWTAGMWQKRWKCLEHLSQSNSSPPVWHTAHTPLSERFNGASRCVSPSSKLLWSIPLLLLWSWGVLWGCTGIWTLSVTLGRVETSSMSWLLTWVSRSGWSPVLSGRFVLLVS